MKHKNDSHMRRRAHRGFSLVELMVVVSIMGLILGLSAHGIRRYLHSWQLNGDVSAMAMMMRAARSTAITKNIDVVFVFDQSEGQYFYLEDTDGDGVADGNELQSGTHTLSNGIVIESFTTPTQWITFTPKGSTADGGTITVENSNNAARTIRVYSGTGNVTMQ
jgi:prepilin-type N-terminal cleavage/methylation domain-containing protein